LSHNLIQHPDPSFVITSPIVATIQTSNQTMQQMVSQEPLATSLPTRSVPQVISSAQPINVNHRSISYHHTQQIRPSSAPLVVTKTQHAPKSYDFRDPQRIMYILHFVVINPTQVASQRSRFMDNFL